jgi:arylformamidase
MGRAFVDLSHVVYDGLITYKGFPAPIICDFLSREASRKFYRDGTSFQIGRIDMIANTGTYIDTPFHRFEDGKDLAEVELSSLAEVDGVVVRTSGMAGRGSIAMFFRDWTCAAGRCWWRRVGRGIGLRTRISRGTFF